MTNLFSALIIPGGPVTFTTITGENRVVMPNNLAYARALELVREIHDRQSRGEDFDDLLIEAGEVTTPVSAIKRITHGRVTVEDDQVFFEGVPIHNVLVERILWMLGEGFDPKPMMLFLDDLMNNTSMQVVEQLYPFLERARMGITDDGCILAYKRVRGDFMDIYTGTIDNTPGSVVEVPRNQVDDNPLRTCSQGLHWCSMEYLPHYRRAPDDRIVIVKVRPSQVVAVPADYDHTKARSCGYTVIAEYTGSQDILKTRPVWVTEDFDNNGHFEPASKTADIDVDFLAYQCATRDHLGGRSPDPATTWECDYAGTCDLAAEFIDAYWRHYRAI